MIGFLMTLDPYEGFAVFILTHGRPDNVVTYDILVKRNYTGPIYLIVDDEDTDLSGYIEKFGQERVIVFSKRDTVPMTDRGDNFDNMKAVVYARNACYKIAKELDLRWFLMLDDDYKNFQYRYKQGDVLKCLEVFDLDKVITAYLQCLKMTPAITMLAMGQGGDMIGGAGGGMIGTVKRKAMNVLFCAVDRPVSFCGTLNEDVTNYVLQGNRGALFFTLFSASIFQLPTQSLAGGMSGSYMDAGTYVKSFYTILYAPSCVKISVIRGQQNARIHHRINWRNAVPRILEESYRKDRGA